MLGLDADIGYYKNCLKESNTNTLAADMTELAKQCERVMSKIIKGESRRMLKEQNLLDMNLDGQNRILMLENENSELGLQRGELENIVKKNENVCLGKGKGNGEEVRVDEILRDDIYKEKLEAKRR